MTRKFEDTPFPAHAEDFIGRPLPVGSYFIYQSGSKHDSMRFGKVKKIVWAKDLSPYLASQGRTVLRFIIEASTCSASKIKEEKAQKRTLVVRWHQNNNPPDLVSTNYIMVDDPEIRVLLDKFL